MAHKCCGMMRRFLSMMLCIAQKLCRILSRYSIGVAAALVLPFILLSTALAQNTTSLPYPTQAQQLHALSLSVYFAHNIARQNLNHQEKLNNSSLFSETTLIYTRLNFSFLRDQQITVAKSTAHHPQSADNQPQPSQALLVKPSDARIGEEHNIARYYATNCILTAVYRCFPASDFDTKT